MRKRCITKQAIVWLIVSLLGLGTMAQTANLTTLAELRNTKTSSLYKAVFRVPADSMAVWVLKDAINIPYLETLQPVWVGADSISRYQISLPLGHYAWVKTVDHALQATAEINTGMSFSNIAHGKKRVLTVYNQQGIAPTGMQAWLHKKSLKWNEASQGFVLPSRKKDMDDKLLLIKSPTDTLISWLYFEERNDYYNDYKKQFKNWPVVKQFRKLGLNIARRINGQYSDYGYNRGNKNKRYKGFVVYSKPVYKTNDTLKFKAWLTNSKGKPRNTAQQVTISYYYKSAGKKIDLGMLKPTEPGSYSMSWPLPDSIPMDTRFTLSLEGEKPMEAFSSDFKTEAYELPDISSFTLSSAKKTWLRKDSLPLVLEAKDASGMSLPDATVSLFILNKNVLHFYIDSLFIPDTLWQKNLPLQTDGLTTVWVPAHALPPANIDVRIQATLRNSSNEIMEKDLNMTHFARQQLLVLERKGAMLDMHYEEDGIPTKIMAQVEGSGDMFESDTTLQLPASIRIHPLATEYDVTALDAHGKVILNETFDLEEDNQEPAIVNQTHADTLAFTLNNPLGMPVWVALMKGTKTVWQKMISETSYSWKEQTGIRDMYTVVLNYYHQGEAKTQRENLGIYYNLLQVNAEVQPTVQPGGSDSMQVTVLDYKGRPQSGVNLTAVAQNAQLQKEFTYPSLPIQMQYKKRKSLKQPSEYEYDDAAVRTDTVAVHFPNILHSLHADTMFYYRRLADTTPLYILRSAQSQALPQIAVHTIKNGTPSIPFITYYNNTPANMHWRNALQAESSIVYQGYVKIGIRTSNQLIEIDSVYMQPHYKHDIFINTDSIYKQLHTRITKMPDTLSPKEIDQLSYYFIQFEQDSKTSGAWIWNGRLQAQIPYSNNDCIAGPFFLGDSIRMYKEQVIDMKFPFEKNYRYRLSQQLVRMEKTPLLSYNTRLLNKPAKWVLGDTAWEYDLPASKQRVEKYTDTRRVFTTSNIAYSTDRWHGALQLQYKTDTAIRYSILIRNNDYKHPWVYAGKPLMIHQLQAGLYRLVLVSAQDEAWSSVDFSVKTNGVNALQINPGAFTQNNKDAYDLYAAQIQNAYDKWQEEQQKIQKEKEKEAPTPVTPVQKGMASISGQVTDGVTGIPLANVTVSIKGSNRGVSTDASGRYTLSNLASANYTLMFAYVGYAPKEVKRFARLIEENIVNVSMEVSVSYLNEVLNDVVVVGYGSTKSKRALTGSITMVTANGLQGRVAGVTVNGNQGAGDVNIQIRGISSFNDADAPLYVVDGVIMDALPTGLDTSIANLEVLKGSAATALYGMRAAQGVIIVTTGKNNGPAIRTQFRDYAYWAPNARTNAAGKAVIPISYPENITGWQHMVYAAQKGGRYGQAFPSTRAFKILQGLLQVPAFLTESDSIYLSGKAVNYSSADKKITTQFTSGKFSASQTVHTAAGASAISYLPLQAPASPDTLKVQFVVKDEKQQQDGEERTIPVLPLGTIDTKGNFFVMESDTSFSFTAPIAGEPIKIFAENNLLNLLENELEALRKYPQACMEQTANKMWGLIMMKQINKQLGKSFKYDALIQKLQTRLLENQRYDGGWSWWEKGDANLYITTRVLQALRFSDTIAPVRKAIREGYLYLQNALPILGHQQKLEALYALSEGKHVYPYFMALDSIPFDSLQIHAQWQYVRIKQNAGINYEKELAALWKKKHQNYSGSIYWGENNWYWYRNIQATTVTAAKVIRDDSSMRKYLPQVKQHFIADKKTTYYTNTVEQAEIVHLMLDDALAAAIRKGGNTSVQINNANISQFPAALTLPASQTVTVRKTGPGLVYLGLSQQQFIKQPIKKDSLFDVQSSLWWKGEQQKTWTLNAGERVTLQVDIWVKKEADFVQIDIPIPAGCSYASKPNNNWKEHREYLKDKVSIFTEHLPAGRHTFSILLETRYAGTFHINPAHISLMYFPTFEGYNQIQTMHIMK